MLRIGATCTLIKQIKDMSINENQPHKEEETLKEAQTQVSDAETSAETATEETQALTTEEKLQKELETLQQQFEEQKDKYLRLVAEFDNFRRRTQKEKETLIKNGGEKTISAILPVIDDMERAIEQAQKTENIEAVIEGLDLIYQKFLKVLLTEGLEKMNPKGEAFDTDFHEAIALVPATEEEQKGKVLDCVQTGYKLNEKVIRHAKVVVGQ